MTTTKRALATSVALLAVGGAVVGSPEPASAHETRIVLGGARQVVGAGHGGIRVCNDDDRWPIAAARWRSSPGGTVKQGASVFQGDCWDTTSTGGVYEHQLCLIYPLADPDHTCSGWKRA
jgi:hypothetical protein